MERIKILKITGKTKGMMKKSRTNNKKNQSKKKMVVKKIMILIGNEQQLLFILLLIKNFCRYYNGTRELTKRICPFEAINDRRKV